MRGIILISAVFASLHGQAQFAPQAGIAGSTAIPANSTHIVAWASQSSVERGRMDIAVPDSGFVSTGVQTEAVGPANGTVVSLGDSGVAVLTFAHPITNGPGYDFAVFENGFPNPMNPEEAFLELAFVEVSSDGTNYVRFPATSLTQTASQIAGAGTYMNASLIHNLAGKYRSGFGVPFNLDELAGKPGLDVYRVTHVRLVDVIGSVGQHSSLDSAGRTINDPYPTLFPTGGFDLDAVGVMHSALSFKTQELTAQDVAIYPNPTSGQIWIEAPYEIADVRVYDVLGNIVFANAVGSNQKVVDLSEVPEGLYKIVLTSKDGKQWSGSIIRR